MTRSRRNFSATVLVVLVGCGAIAWRTARETTRLRADAVTVKTQMSNAREAQRQALASAKVPVATSPESPPVEDDELILLRAETHALAREFEMRKQAQVAQKEKWNAELAAAAERRAKAAAALAPGLWKNVGRANPVATSESVLWAIEGGDVAALGEAIAFDPDAQREADRFYAALPPATRAEYGDAHELVASILTAKLPASFATMNATKQVSSGPDDMAVTFEMQRVDPKRRPQTANLHFHRANGDWQLLVPASVIDGYRRLLVDVPFEP